MKKSNLLVSFDPAHLESAKKEIEEIFKEVKDGKIIENGKGWAEIAVKDARDTIKKIEKIAKKDIEKLKFTIHWTPIDKWCKNSIVEMKKHLKGFVKGIKENERWKMELKTRKLKQKPDEVKLIINLTEAIERKNVDLDKPEKIVRVEIIGNKAGLSLLKPEEILNLNKIREK